MSYDHDEPRLREEASALITEAFQDAPYMTGGVMLEYSGYALVVRAGATNHQNTSIYAFTQLDRVFQAAGWERRISTPNKIHAYVPGWLPRL